MNSYYEKSSFTPNHTPTIHRTDKNINHCCQTPNMNCSPMIHKNSSKRAFFSEHTQKNTRNKSISFSQDSPKRYAIPDSFKTPPSPNKFRDSLNSPRLSSILRNKQFNQSYEKQIMRTPSSSFKNTFNEKAQGSISPLINRYACFSSSKVINKNDEKNNDAIQSHTLIITFIIASCIITLVLIWL